MIRIEAIKLPVDYKEEDLINKIKKILRIDFTPKFQIARKSIDARKKDQLFYILKIDVIINNEEKFIKKANNKDVKLYKPFKYEFPFTNIEQCNSSNINNRPVIIGAGPAGYFAALYLARNGFNPILFERGKSVYDRIIDVDKYWNEGILSNNSNVSFGEGGAGTFSDGKLNTGIKDKTGRIDAVIKDFHDFGGPDELLYINNPHIGTDNLVTILKKMRTEIIKYGGEINFESQFIKFEKLDNNNVKCYIKNSERTIEIETSALILAIGHSSRDTFEYLNKSHIKMEQKPFAIGVRIEHPREMINKSQYGSSEAAKQLPTANYKLTHKASNGRSVFSFCMCPGGYVVNGATEDGMICVNGMSYFDRMAQNSNSAMVVNITPDDFLSDDPLAGVEFQRHIEKLCFDAGKGKVPIQLYGDFKEGIPSTKLGEISPCIKGDYELCELSHCLPQYVKSAIIDGINDADKKMPGFGRYDALLSGVESRTSSPVKIIRNEDYCIDNLPIYPCGEGAGYAGGITSAAVDGIKVSESVAKRLLELNKEV